MYEEIEYQLSDLIAELKARRSGLNPEISEEYDVIYELEQMEQDLKNAVNRIGNLKRFEL